MGRKTRWEAAPLADAKLIDGHLRPRRRRMMLQVAPLADAKLIDGHIYSGDNWLPSFSAPCRCEADRRTPQVVGGFVPDDDAPLADAKLIDGHRNTPFHLIIIDEAPLADAKLIDGHFISGGACFQVWARPLPMRS